MRTRTLGTEMGDVAIREWGDEVAQTSSPAGGLLLLLATEPPSAREQNEVAGHTFKAVIHRADIRMVEGATHSLVTDRREELGRTVADWLATLDRRRT